MRVLAVLIALALVAVPLAACGGGGYGCTPLCATCGTFTDCCDYPSGAVCSAPGGPPGVCNFGAGSCGF
jgi:hypothetical protein